ncbi:hypothetical protein ACHAPA_007093 [Fusarium lateritium]
MVQRPGNRGFPGPFRNSMDTSLPETPCSTWPYCPPNCACDPNRSRDAMSSSEMAGIALDMGRAQASRESAASDIPRSPWPEFHHPIDPHNPFAAPEAVMASLLDQRRNGFSLPPQRTHRTHRTSRQSSRQPSRLSSHPYPARPIIWDSSLPPRPVSHRPLLSSDMPDIDGLNIDVEGESSGSATRLSNQSDTLPPDMEAQFYAYESEMSWELDYLIQSASGAVPDDHMLANLMAENDPVMSLPESEEVEADDADSTTGQDGSDPDLAPLDRSTRLDLLARYESIVKNLRNGY